MGFQFAETMSGTVEWDARPGAKQPFRFEVTVTADSTRDHLATGKAALRGIVHAPPHADGAPAEGVITIRPLGQRTIRYELEFAGDDGTPYVLVGQKAISWLRPRATFTHLPAEIFDEAGKRVGRCELHFDLGRDWWSFLRSFRPI